ncbi:hypothetical protein EDEG_03267 [Edhazardia aedis USNM 41457]|uniref:Transcription factor IIIC subunit 5 HTH domain-containing protein n=1 Tax=Edhazardia aedis (strain USNM 41457) TaxID=1003232 RepID=J9D420_EDHAE|nr:hypothetical protein EDEG_03267 [Edhazardia aedis USNM 41457]|eukprot:EJW02294.1 hypothetical protein EDEG_03267 [Edhazardia aedis USNM 41457]
MKLIYYLHTLEKDEEINLIDLNDKVKIRFKDTLDSPFVILEPKKKKNTFYILEINDDEKVKLLGKTNTLYQSKQPADFYVPVSTESTQYYEDLYSKLVDLSPDECINYFMQNNNILNIAPLYPPPEFTQYPISTVLPGIRKVPKNPEFPRIITLGKEIRKVPTEPCEESVTFLKERYSDVYNIVVQHYHDFFNTRPIFSNVDFKPELKKFNEKNDVNLSLTAFKMFITVVAYYVKSGPFLMCWIRFGTDLSKNSDNYRYQRLTKYRIPVRRDFIFMNKELEELIDSNKSKYVSDSFDETNGFFKNSLLQLIKDYYKKEDLESLICSKDEDSFSENECIDFLE